MSHTPRAGDPHDELRPLALQVARTLTDDRLRAAATERQAHALPRPGRRTIRPFHVIRAAVNVPVLRRRPGARPKPAQPVGGDS